MDKSWMDIRDRTSVGYRNGVAQFLNFASQHAQQDGMIVCPCRKCAHSTMLAIDDVQIHLVSHGICRGYRRWTFHRESSSRKTSVRTPSTSVQENSNENSNMREMLHHTFPMHDMVPKPMEEDMALDLVVGDPGLEQPTQGPNEESLQFPKLLKDVEEPCYEGCTKFSKLSVIVYLYHLKCLLGWSNISITFLLQFLQELLPSSTKLPKDCYEAKKIIKDLGLSYEKIDACPNDCMLFWKENSNLEACSNCNHSRWASNEAGVPKNTNAPSKKVKKKVAKILRWFPLKPRLKRLFMSPEVAPHMKWHVDGRTNDGLMRHPAYSEAWNSFDSKYVEFSSEPLNVRLELADDEFNPFSNMSTAHSTWPVMLVLYNLPPWMFMKRAYFMLSLLILGPTSPGNDIDVYLQPLIQELKELWDVGVETFDVSSNSSFQMHAALLWTINDFPTYADLSGWSTKGALACPSCNYNPQSRWLKHGRKFSYIGHRRFLDRDHEFHNHDKEFDGRTDFSKAPDIVPRSEIIAQTEPMVNVVFGKKKDNLTNKRKRGEDALCIWKKRSIFFSLPYWENHMLRHNLDVMHIEKNVVDNVIGTVLNMDGKTNDNLKVHLDLEEMGIRSELYLEELGSDKTYKPPAYFEMTTSEKDSFLQVLKGVSVPDGYASNVSRCAKLKERKISGMKSHDSHILMQQLFPIAIRGSLPDEVSKHLIELSCFFREICSKVLSLEDLESFQKRIALTLCELERIFPPSFFTVMVHLLIHLTDEAKIAGPVHCRWMYPVEWYLSRLKSYVRNKACLEGCIAEGVHRDHLKELHPNVANDVMEKQHMERFCHWFKYHVLSMDVDEREKLPEKVIWLARYPDNEVKWFKHYVLNGLKFRTKDSELRYVLFKCEWVDVDSGRGYKTDKFGFPLVNFARLIHKGDRLIDEPDVFDVGTGALSDDDVDNFCENDPYNITIDNAHDVNDNPAWTRRDVEGTIYQTPLFVECELVEDDNIDDEEFIDDVYESNDEFTDDENEDGEELNDGSNDESTDNEKRANVYVKVHLHKDGTPVNAEAESNISSDLTGSILWAPDDVYAQVFGNECNGHVQGVGFGPTPSMHPAKSTPAIAQGGFGLDCQSLTPYRSQASSHQEASG
ncbi:uncharacterized protein LOC142617065 [Castanea sativa]|uniref:uncharacterized protein LOC142617065 n=1 Tax=Castanea sativa TaxID=21020 RepID=UPI003F64A488